MGCKVIRVILGYKPSIHPPTTTRVRVLHSSTMCKNTRLTPVLHNKNNIVATPRTDYKDPPPPLYLVLVLTSTSWSYCLLSRRSSSSLPMPYSTDSPSVIVYLGSFFRFHPHIEENELPTRTDSCNVQAAAQRLGESQWITNHWDDEQGGWC